MSINKHFDDPQLFINALEYYCFDNQGVYFQCFDNPEYLTIGYISNLADFFTLSISGIKKWGLMDKDRGPLNTNFETVEGRQEFCAYLNNDASAMLKLHQKTKENQYKKDKLNKDTFCLGRKSEYPEFQDLLGAKILDIGFHPKSEEGGFGIDYEKYGIKKRIVLGFTELGMWVQFQGNL